MSDASSSFPFGQSVPGFDFLKSLAAGATQGMPGLVGWVAPTLSVEDLEKRLSELKTVQFWLEQNLHALKATIQALEVQKMTLSTLQGMNVRMEDVATAFMRPMASAGAAFQAGPEDPGQPKEQAPSEAAKAEAPSAAGVVDPLQWWGALTQQFQQVAGSVLQEAARRNAQQEAATKAAPEENTTAAEKAKRPRAPRASAKAQPKRTSS